jgi:hypothetical protein
MTHFPFGLRARLGASFSTLAAAALVALALAAGASSIQAQPTDYRLDDGTGESTISLNNTPDYAIICLNRFDVIAGLEILTAIDIVSGNPANPGGSGIVGGEAITVLVYDDPNNDGDPNDGVLVASVPGNISLPNVNNFQRYNLTTPVNLGIPGDRFFIGITGSFSTFKGIASRDTTSASNQMSWIGVAIPSANANISNLSSYNAFGPLAIIDTFSLPGNWMIRGIAGPSGPDCQNPPLVSDLDLTATTLNKVSATQGVSPMGGLLPAPATSSDFPSAMAALNIDGQGGADVLAVASRKTQHVWLLQLDASGNVTAMSRFGGTTGEGGFPVSAQGGLIAGDGFGTSLAWLGSGEGMAELAVGAPGEDGLTANSNRGGVWFLEINLANAFDGDAMTDPVSSVIALLDGDAAVDGFTSNGPMNNVGFGSSLAALDVEPDGVVDWLAIGAANRVNAMEHQAGGVWLFDLANTLSFRFAAPDEGTYAATQSRFGDSAAWLGDMDGDGTFELAVGAPHHRGALGGQTQAGVIHIRSFDLSGAQPAAVPGTNVTIGGSTGLNGIPAGALGQADFFGQSLAFLGDADGDFHVELAAGAPGDDDGGSNQGAVWVLSIDPCDRSASMVQAKVSEATTVFSPATVFADDLGAGLDSTDYFGWSLAPLGDLGGGLGLAAGSLYDDDGGSNRGAFWVLGLMGGGSGSQGR